MLDLLDFSNVIYYVLLCIISSYLSILDRYTSETGGAELPVEEEDKKSSFEEEILSLKRKWRKKGLFKGQPLFSWLYFVWIVLIKQSLSTSFRHSSFGFALS